MMIWKVGKAVRDITKDLVGPMKGYFPTPNISYVFNPTSNTPNPHF